MVEAGDDEFGFHLSDEERKRMYGDFDPSLGNFDPTINDVIYGLDVSADWSKIQVWDDCVPTNDKREINNKNLASVVRSERCPLLKQPRDAVYFMFCWQLANAKTNDGKQFTASPSLDSAQYAGRIPVLKVELCCTCPDKFKSCEKYTGWFGR